MSQIINKSIEKSSLKPKKLEYFINKRAIEKSIPVELIAEDREREFKKKIRKIIPQIKIVYSNTFLIDGDLVYFPAKDDNIFEMVTVANNKDSLLALESRGVFDTYGIDGAKLRAFLSTQRRQIVRELNPYIEEDIIVDDGETIFLYESVKINMSLVTHKAQEAVLGHYGKSTFTNLAKMVVLAPYATNKKKNILLVTGGSNSGKTTIFNAFSKLGVVKELPTIDLLTESAPSPIGGKDIDNKSLLFNDQKPTNKLYSLNGKAMLSPKGRSMEIANLGMLIFTHADDAFSDGLDDQMLNRMSLLHIKGNLENSFKDIPMVQTEETIRYFVLMGIREVGDIFDRDYSDASHVDYVINEAMDYYKVDDTIKRWDDEVLEVIEESLLQSTYEESRPYKENNTVVEEVTTSTDVAGGERVFFIATPKYTLQGILHNVDPTLAINMKRKTTEQIAGIFKTEAKSYSVGGRTRRGIKITVKTDRGLGENLEYLQLKDYATSNPYA